MLLTYRDFHGFVIYVSLVNVGIYFIRDARALKHLKVISKIIQTVLLDLSHQTDGKYLLKLS